MKGASLPSAGQRSFSKTSSAIRVSRSPANRPFLKAHPAWPEEFVIQFSDDRKHLSVPHPKPAKAVLELVKWIDGAGIVLDDIHIRRPTLEDVFIELTGKSLRD